MSAGHSRAPLSTLLGSAVSLGLAGWLSVRYLLIGIETSGARYVALSSLPPIWAYALSTASVAAVGGFVLREWLRGAPPGDRPYRLGPMLLVLIAALHFLVMPTYRTVPVTHVVAAQLELFRETTEFGEQLPDELSGWEDLALYPPPFLRDGAPLESWSLLMRQGCTGPLTEAPAGIETGTLVICLSSARDEAWVTPIGIDGDYTGRPAVMRYAGQPIYLPLRASGSVPAAWQQFPTDGIRAANEDPPAPDAGP